MVEVLALCGYRCDLCQFYIRNARSEEHKERVSREFTEIFGDDIRPEDVECVGCRSKGKHVDTACPVRPCALEKGVENCAHCSEFICDKLKTRINFAEEFLRDRENPLSDSEYQSYIRPYQSRERMMEINRKGKRRSSP